MTDTITTTHRATATSPAEPTPGELPEGHDWEQAGDAWGQRARDWACLFEHYAIDTIGEIHRQVGVGPDQALLDIACGSGLALRMADSAGADTAGIDAAAPLIAVARDRNPDADLRVGTMFELPWSDGTFDAVTAINGIWGGCEQALVEAYRVLKPGGRIGMSFWGGGKPFDLKECFIAFALNSPKEHLEGMVRTNDVGKPGVAERMLEQAGFTVLHRDSRVSQLEWPDDDTAWRALSSVGPAVPALQNVGAEVLRPLVLDALQGCRDDRGIYRFRNVQHFVIAEKPAA